MPEVMLGGQAVPYTLVRNARSRHVRMTFTPEGLRVSAPTRLPQAEVDRAVASKERWLLRHHDLLAPLGQGAKAADAALLGQRRQIGREVMALRAAVERSGRGKAAMV